MDVGAFGTVTSWARGVARVTTASADGGEPPAEPSYAARLVSQRAAQRNLEAGAAAATVSEGALVGATEILLRMRELAVQAGNGTLSQAQRGALQKEVNSLSEQLGGVSASTAFNGLPLLRGGELTIQAGTGPGNTLAVPTPNVSPAALGLGTLDLRSGDGARGALGVLDEASRRLGVASGAVGSASGALVRAGESLAASQLAAGGSSLWGSGFWAKPEGTSWRPAQLAAYQRWLKSTVGLLDLRA